MLIDIEVKELDVSYPAWTYGKEKSFMLIKSSLDQNKLIEKAFDILIPSLKDKKLPIADKKLALITGRINLSGDIVDVRFTCSHCNMPTEGQYSIEESIRYTKSTNNTFDVGTNTFEVEDIEVDNPLRKIVAINGCTSNIIEFIDDLSIKEVNDILHAIKAVSFGDLHLDCSVRCVLCNKLNRSIIDQDDKLINTIIEYDSIKSFYETELDLKKSANFSLEEIHNLMPFEISVYIGLINARTGE